MTLGEGAFDALLTDVRAFVREVAIPAEETVDRTDAVPEDIVQIMRERGFFGWSIPAEYGGGGLSCEQLIRAAFELAQAATAFRARVGTNTGIGSEALIRDGSPEQKARWLPKLASGELTGCLAVTEPDAGSEASNIQTTARRDGDSYVLNGTKRYITNAPIARLFTVLARTDPDAKGAQGVSGIVVEGPCPGLSVGSPYKKMGQAGSPVSEVHFSDCAVPAANLIGTEGDGFRSVMKVLNKQRIHLAALCTGSAIRMADEAKRHARNRHQFGRPVGEHQLVQAMIADNETDVAAARALILDTARRFDAGEDIRMAASMCKYFASEACGRVADRAVQIFGGAGYIAEEACIERLYRDARLFRLYEGTSQIHQLTIAKFALAADL